MGIGGGEGEGSGEQAMNACSLRAESKLLAHAQNRLQLLACMRVILSFNHRLAEIHGAAKPVIFQVKTLGLSNRSVQWADRRLGAPIGNGNARQVRFRN